MHLLIYCNFQCKYLVTILIFFFGVVFSAWPSRSARLDFVISLWLCSFVFVIISFNLLYCFFGIKSIIKIVVVVVSLLRNLGCSEGICDFCPQSFAS